MVLHRRVLFSLAITATAEAILIRTSAEQVRSLHRVAPRCLKLITSSNFWPNMLISALMMFVLLVMILLFSMLTSIPYAVALSASLLVRFWSSPLLPPIRSMSSANRRLHMGLPPMGVDMWWSWSVSCMIFSRGKLNRMGESKHPWQTTTVVSKNSPGWLHPLGWTRALVINGHSTLAKETAQRGRKEAFSVQIESRGKL